MFKFFRKKSELEKLQSKYKSLLKESFELSKINRTKADEKTLEAEEILKEIDAIKNKSE